MNGDRVLLDTNIVILILNQNNDILERIRGISLYVPSIVLGELYYGARHSGNVERNLAKIEVFRLRSIIVPCDAITADFYGHVKQELSQKGRPIPENDLWIAALAHQYSLSLVSRDRHFDAISDLKLDAW